MAESLRFVHIAMLLDRGCTYLFDLSNKSLERKGDPLQYLESFSVLLTSGSDIKRGLKTLGNFGKRKVPDKKAFGHGLMLKLFLSETFRDQ